MIDVGSEWRTFSNDKAGVDPSRVGGPENPLLNGSDLSTMIGPGTGSASFDELGVSKYQNRRTVSKPPCRKFRIEIHFKPIGNFLNHSRICIRTKQFHSNLIRRNFSIRFNARPIQNESGQSQLIRISPNLQSE